MGSRDEILGKIKTIRQSKKFDTLPEHDWDTEALAPLDAPLDACFKAELEAVNGHCVLVESKKELKEELTQFFATHKVKKVACLSDALITNLPGDILVSDINEADASLTECESLIAGTGSALVSSASTKSRVIQIFPPVHVIIANESQLVPHLSNAIEYIEKKYAGNLPSQISLITGPSRTADIEKTLVLGAHGPKELLVFIIKNT